MIYHYKAKVQIAIDEKEGNLMMKKKFCFAISLLVILIGILTYVQLQTKNTTTTKTFQTIELEDWNTELSDRYLILYHTKEQKYYLASVTNSSLDTILYDLGDSVFNFDRSSTTKQLILVSNQMQYQLTSTNIKKTNSTTTPATLGLVYLNNGSQNTIQILSAIDESGCEISLADYDKFIAIDMIDLSVTNVQ